MLRQTSLSKTLPPVLLCVEDSVSGGLFTAAPNCYRAAGGLIAVMVEWEACAVKKGPCIGLS